MHTTPKGFLESLRKLCDKHGAVLIFDEVMTGFRLSPGGASQKYNIQPDMVCLGKVIGGGLPVGAFGGKEEIMNMVAPLGPVYKRNPFRKSSSYDLWLYTFEGTP
ncbi:MAG: hypothetical protein CM15mP23_06630 [Cryomorphaceae bacterium]|nr:MAG: hypothetical protein CM15mP23_06630 [Cryomorphaceae bacterium]